MFEWDEAKAVGNLRKHGIALADAATVFDDDQALVFEDLMEEEERFIALGLDLLGRILVVAYTWRSDRIRIISPRRATQRETRRYEESR